MIASFAALALAAAIGCGVIWRFAGIAALRPRWAALALAFGSGCALGVGATSILWFLATLAAPGWRIPVVLTVEGLALAGTLAALGFRPGDSVPKPLPGGRGSFSQTEPRPPGSGGRYAQDRMAAPVPAGRPKWAWSWLAGCAVLVALVIVSATLAPFWEANPQGNWDAWTIWNLRAKYLASGPATAARAWSPLLADTHPEYPLLLSGAVARCWAMGAAGACEIPIAIGFLLFLSLVAAITGAIALARGSSSGLIAGLVLLCTPGLTVHAPTQYSDIPLAAFYVCAVGFALLDRPVWAGAFAGMSAWTKDEGVLFCAVLLAGLAWFRRRDLPRAAAGMVPCALLVASFKLFLAPQISAFGGAGAFARMFDLQRLLVTMKAMATYFIGLGVGPYHPALPIAALGLGVGLRRDGRKEALPWTLVAVALLAGYSLALLTTPSDLQWQISTALDRLMAQWWPLAVIAAMMWLRSAEEAAPPAVVQLTPPGRERRKKH